METALSLTRGFLEAAPDRMEAWLQRRGFYGAEVEVTLEEDPERRFQVLRATIERGPRHILHRVDFEGNEVIDDEELRIVMDQASDEVIRLNRVTAPELDQAVSAVADVYRSRGYLDVEAELVRVQVTGRLRELTESGRAPLGRTITRPHVEQRALALPWRRTQMTRRSRPSSTSTPVTMAPCTRSKNRNNRTSARMDASSAVVDITKEVIHAPCFNLHFIFGGQPALPSPRRGRARRR